MYFVKQRVGYSQAENATARSVEKLKRRTGEDQCRDIDVRVGCNLQHLPPLPALLPSFGDKAWQIGFRQSQLAGARLPIRDETPPTAILEVSLDGLTHDFGGSTALFIRCGFYLCDKGRW